MSELFNLRESNFFGDVRDAEIVGKFNRLHEQAVIHQDAMQVLSSIAGKNGWNQEQEAVLANTTADQYYDLFKSIKGKELSSYVNACLQFGRFANADEKQKKIAVNATDALKRIAAESEINNRRVRKFGIEIIKSS